MNIKELERWETLKQKRQRRRCRRVAREVRLKEHDEWVSANEIHTIEVGIGSKHGDGSWGVENPRYRGVLGQTSWRYSEHSSLWRHPRTSWAGLQGIRREDAAMTKWVTTLLTYELDSKSHRGMASSTFNLLHQNHLFHNTPFRSNFSESISIREHEKPSNPIISKADRKYDSGFSSSNTCFERVEKKSNVGSVVEKKKNRNPRRNSYVKGDYVNSRGVNEMSSGFSPLRKKGERMVTETKARFLSDEKAGKKKFERSENGRQVGEGNMNRKCSETVAKVKVEVGEGKMDKIPMKKNKTDSLRLGLDMCSKRGDVLGAISLYDSAHREGIKLGQHHYTVLLYLCASASIGVVRPAKSGSGGRSIDKVDLANDMSSGHSVDLNNNGDIGNANSHAKMPVPNLSAGQLLNYDNLNGVASSMSYSNSGVFQLESVEKNDTNVFSQNGKIKLPYSGLSDGGKIGVNQHPIQTNTQNLHGVTNGKGKGDSAAGREVKSDQENGTIQVTEDVKRYALMRGIEIYENMLLKKIPLNEAALTSVARMAMSMGDGMMALDMVKQMKELGIKPRLRSYGPALFTFCKNGDLENAFMVEKQMLEDGVHPEEPELEALLKLSVEAGNSEKVYYLLHKLRMAVRKVSYSTLVLIERWFRSIAASSVGKRKWDRKSIMEAMENGGGGWHGQGWLGRGKWTIAQTSVGNDGICHCCREKLATVDLDPIETENFAKSVLSIATQREKNSSFQKFQEWLDYYGPFEAVVDAANVGLFNQQRFVISKVNAIVNAIRQKLPSKRWPLIIVHHKRVTGRKMNEPANKLLLEKWKTAEALYLTPTGSNDDWYWLYAAIKFKCLLVTNDEMRDHIFQLLGNDFFPRWKERHQVRFTFHDGGPELHMPPPYSVAIQESEQGYWHIPVASEHDSETEAMWLCVTRASRKRRDAEESKRKEQAETDDLLRTKMKLLLSGHGNSGMAPQTIRRHKELYRNLRNIMFDSVPSNHQTLLSDIEAAEKLGGCIIDFQI
ncbi:hypothetical protein Sjap_011404 [Stephania japonica]|uniref:ribonuclease P n=1 Tax=Stephania japonica TaxID=461633 RepID=A0AAP0JB20_9MAGN